MMYIKTSKKGKTNMSEIEPTNEIERIQDVIDRAAEVVEPGGKPLEVFPDPRLAERRDKMDWVKGDSLPTNTVVELRTIMAEVGPGRMHNIGAEQVGLVDNGFVAFIDGGKPNKMIAELNVLAKDTDIRPSMYIFGGSPDRFLKDDEQALGRKLLDGATADNELDMAVQVVRAHSEFTALDEPVELHDDPRHSITWVGMLDNRPVYTMGIKRLSPSGERQPKVRTEERMQMAAQLGEGAPVAFTTGALYVPSAEVAAHHSGVDAVVLSYGTEEMARVQGVEHPVLPSVTDLGAEAYKTAAFLAGQR